MATSWCDVRLPNHYTHAKFEKILPITSKNCTNAIKAYLEMLLRCV